MLEPRGTRHLALAMNSDAHGRLEEPQLKYESLGGNVKDIIASAEVSCLCLSDKILAIGTSKGNVHVLDYSGDEASTEAFDGSRGALGRGNPRSDRRPCLPPAQIRRLELHTGRVNELSFDQQEEHIASCSDDCTVSVSELLHGLHGLLQGMHAELGAPACTKGGCSRWLQPHALLACSQVINLYTNVKQDYSFKKPIKVRGGDNNTPLSPSSHMPASPLGLKPVSTPSLSCRPSRSTPGTPRGGPRSTSRRGTTTSCSSARRAGSAAATPPSTRATCSWCGGQGRWLHGARTGP